MVLASPMPSPPPGRSRPALAGLSVCPGIVSPLSWAQFSVANTNALRIALEEPATSAFKGVGFLRRGWASYGKQAGPASLPARWLVCLGGGGVVLSFASRGSARQYLTLTRDILPHPVSGAGLHPFYLPSEKGESQDEDDIRKVFAGIVLSYLGCYTGFVA